ncbi:STAS/SEC14 domain-containing protein, partial [Candidatus Peregrinibacteria bacterium]|nr:STAS/SEC14 domain-containing protein [Candidatus Peregrinibacteria bacterium]
SRYTPQPEVVLSVISELMSEARQKKFRRAAVVQKGVIVGMMIGRLATATGLGEVRYFTSLEAARKWLDGI